MRNGRFLLGFIAFCCTSLLACTDGTETLDPDKLPYKLEEVSQYGQIFPVDLDGDGRDELAHIEEHGLDRKWGALKLYTQDGKTIEQVNYAEPIRSGPHFLDLENDGTLEILVSFVRNDSLFASIVSAKGHKLYQIYLTKGKPRMVEAGPIPWDPNIVGVFKADVDADGRDELVTVIATSYARLPRGVWVHSLPDGELLGQSIIGANPNRDESFLGDFDEDGRPEVMFATGASNNGAIAGGMDDQHSYLVAFDLDPPRVKWKKEKGGSWTNMYLFTGNLDGDSENEFLAFKQTLPARPTPAQLQLIDPRTGNSYREHVLAEPITGIALVDLNRDGRDEILALGISGELKVLNDKLELVDRRRVADKSVYQGMNSISVLPDVDGDGVGEIIVQTRSGSVLLDPQLRVKAVYPVQGAFWIVIQQGVDRLPYLSDRHGGQTYVFRLVKNHSYLVNRYGPSLVWIVLVGLVGLWLAGGFLVVSNYRKNRQLDKAIRNIVRKYIGQAEDDFIDRASEVVGTHYSDPRFNVQAFADEMECSPRTLQRDLQAKIGCSPSKFIRTFRLEHAKKLLADSELIIKEIAHKVGFESPEHFSTTFRKDEDVSPSVYRKSVASSNSSKSS